MNPKPQFNRSVENLIANLRGIPESTSRAWIRPEKHLSQLLNTLQFKESLDQRCYDSILKNWEALLGPQYAGRCNPARLIENGSVLVMDIPNATLRQHLQFQKGQLLQKLQKLPYCGKLRGLVFAGAGS